MLLSLMILEAEGETAAVSGASAETYHSNQTLQCLATEI